MRKPFAGRLALIAALFVFASTGVMGSIARAEAPAAQVASAVDLNSASQNELEALKGVGAATAKKIIAGRPYQSVDELAGKGVPAKTVEMIRPFVTVGRATIGGTKAAGRPVVVPSLPSVPPPPSVPPAPRAALPVAPGGLVDLNTASESSLEALPGVGPATGKAIIAARPYASVEDLSKVKGIGPGKLATLRGLVTVSGAKATAPAPAPAPKPIATPTPPPPPVAVPAAPRPTALPTATPRPAASTTKLAPGQKVNLNTASLGELEALPGIGPVKAQKIIDGRPYAKPEDVMKVSGIKEGIFGKIKDSVTVQ